MEGVRWSYRELSSAFADEELKANGFAWYWLLTPYNFFAFSITPAKFSQLEVCWFLWYWLLTPKPVKRALTPFNSL